METRTLGILSQHMPEIMRYKSQFSSLNALLGKTTLTGKISSLDIAENLFIFMEETRQKFEGLQDRLISTLIEQKFLNRYGEALSSSKTVGDILTRNLYERAADMVMLSRSRLLVDFMTQYAQNHTDESFKQSFEELKRNLEFFQALYTVHKDVVIFDREGKVIFSLKKIGQDKTKIPEVLQMCSLDVISRVNIENTNSTNNANKKEEAKVNLSSANYKEFFCTLDFYKQDEKTYVAEQQDRDKKRNTELVYVAPIGVEGSASLGACMLVFDFDGEVNRIKERFSYPLPYSSLVICDTKNNIIFSDNLREFKIDEYFTPAHYEKYTFSEVKKISLVGQEIPESYRGYSGLATQLKYYRIVPLLVAFGSKYTKNISTDSKFHTSLNSNLEEVISDAESINEDLGDVVINGEIIASKSHSYALNPILNSIRLLSEEINALCMQSTDDLQQGIFTSLYHNIDKYAYYIVELLDREFYERSNDCRWVCRNSTLRDFLELYEKAKLDSLGTLLGQIQERQEEVNKILKSLNDSFSVYSNIALFDANGTIVSHLMGENLMGDKIPLSSNITILKNQRNALQYTISPFEQNNLSQTPAYIYYTPIFSNPGDLKTHREGKFLGGLAFVINSDEYQKILEAALPKNSYIFSEQNEIFSFVLNSNKQVIVKSGNVNEENLSAFLLEMENELNFKDAKSFKKIISIDNKKYLLCGEFSKGYREFSHEDRHVSPMVAIMLVSIH